ncbi:hypothetical protein MK489_13465 [Myxococcota bacterium]|nr:hypothetical protein [Myxococcota bacterium]
MAVPTHEQLKQWAQGYVEHWNSGDKEAWRQNWLSVAPGDFTMWDPVGTPSKHGFEHCALDSYDLFQPAVRFHVPPETCFFNGNEVAWVMQNLFERDGETQRHNSIETYQFGDDGSVVIRTYYVVPSHDDAALGEIFQTYLPGEK